MIPPIIKELMELWPLFSFLTVAIVGAVLLYLSTRFMPRKACKLCRDELEAGIREQEALLRELAAREADRRAGQEALKAALAALPSKDDLQAIALAVKGMEGEIKTVAAKVEGQREALARMEKSVDLLTEAHLGDSK